jgi:hypothetical protein
MLTKKIGWVAFFHKLIWSPCLSVIWKCKSDTVLVAHYSAHTFLPCH